MKLNKHVSVFFFVMASFIVAEAQEVPYGINYQAVARDSYGNEITNQEIDIRFTVISTSPLGEVQYQEIHNNVSTSRFGVFSVTIGKGTPITGICESFSMINWELAPHFLKVEIKFSNEFLDMGTMQFLSVPYALYAAKSLEPGPEGPPGPQGDKGDPGDPATDDQTLSFDGENLSISGGNEVNLSTLLNVDDADADPLNEIQDLRIEDNILKITGNADPTNINLSGYLDNTDEQDLSFNSSDSTIMISNGNPADLSTVLRDEDTDAGNELITGVSIDGTELVINEGVNENRVDLSSNIIAFRAKKTENTDAAMPLSNVDFIPDTQEFNDGLCFNMSTGEFTASHDGIYTYNIKYSADGDGSGRALMIYRNGNLYENLGQDISSGTKLYRSVTMKLVSQDKVKLVIHTGTGTAIGTGNFSGYKVY
ncbi:MAG: C1q-like domain-containing protein [Bacteroidota bacterium]